MATNGTLAPPSPDDFATEEAYRAAQQTYGLLTGQSAWGAPVSLTSYSNASTYAQTIDNQGAGGLHLNVPGIMTVTDTGVAAGVVTAGTVNATNLNVTGNTILGDAAGDSLTVNATSTFAAPVTVNAALAATATVALGDDDADTQTFIGISQWRNAANTQFPLRINVANNHVIVGAPSTMTTGITAPDLQVIGRLYVAPDSANDLALEIRRSSAATVGWDIGVTSTNDLVFKDLTGTETFRAGAAASVYQATVTGILRATNGIAVVASGILISAGGLTVTGTTTFHSGFTLDGPSNIDGNGGTAGQIRIGGVIVNAASFTSGEVLLVNGISRLKGLIQSESTNTVFSLIGTTQTQTTVGVAGGASALPATPSGYIKGLFGATSIVVPYYLA